MSPGATSCSDSPCPLALHGSSTGCPDPLPLEEFAMTAADVVRRRIVPGVLFAALAFAASCKDDPASPIEGAGDPENISRVTVTLKPVGGGSDQVSFRVDPDGTQLPQAVGPAQGTLALSKGKTYNGSVALANDIDPKNVVDITAEVRKEANFHRFFYTLSCSGVTVPISSLDLDTQSPAQPVGINFQVVVDANAAATTNCTLRVELHHFETAKGNGLGSTFDTDLDIAFPVTIS